VAVSKGGNGITHWVALLSRDTPGPARAGQFNPRNLHAMSPATDMVDDLRSALGGPKVILVIVIQPTVS
jgi:hypothetical protein